MSDDTPPAPDWDARFAGDDFLFGTMPNGFLASCGDLIRPGGRVLSVADGEGRNGTWLAQQGFAVDAFDGSAVGVAKARRLAADRGVAVTYEVARIDEWAWPEAVYDAVAAIFVQFSPPAERRWVFGRILRALRPGGVLLLEGYDLGQLAHGTGGPKTPDQLYTGDQLRAELADFTIASLREYETEVAEGPAHSGTSALIDVVAHRPD